MENLFCKIPCDTEQTLVFLRQLRLLGFLIDSSCIALHQPAKKTNHHPGESNSRHTVKDFTRFSPMYSINNNFSGIALLQNPRSLFIICQELPFLEEKRKNKRLLGDFLTATVTRFCVAFCKATEKLLELM